MSMVNMRIMDRRKTKVFTLHANLKLAASVKEQRWECDDSYTV